MRKKIFKVTAMAGLAALLVGGIALPDIASAQAKKKKAAVAGTPMRYFRVTRLSDCNVYMNYSYWDNPKFRLMVINPSALTTAEAAFVEKFNERFFALMQKRPDACDRTRAQVAAQSTNAVLSNCLRQEAVMGYSESGWQGGRLPAPSNCISYRNSSPGVLDLLPRSLPTTSMSIEAWITKAAAGR